MVLGAAIAGALPNNPAWETAYGETLVGGVLSAMLSPAGGFGRFCVVVLSLTLLGNTAGTMYAISLNFQTLLMPGRIFLRVPRYVYAIIVTAIVIPVAIKAADDFFVNLENFVAVIGYWSAAFVGIVVAEDLVFRRRYRSDGGHGYAAYIWTDARKLPVGVAAVASGILAFGLVVPCMAQVWWTGPIAKKTGDIGFEVAFVLSAGLYVPLRMLERRFAGR